MGILFENLIDEIRFIKENLDCLNKEYKERKKYPYVLEDHGMTEVNYNAKKGYIDDYYIQSYDRFDSSYYKPVSAEKWADISTNKYFQENLKVYQENLEIERYNKKLKELKNTVTKVMEYHEKNNIFNWGEQK